MQIVRIPCFRDKIERGKLPDAPCDAACRLRRSSVVLDDEYDQEAAAARGGVSKPLERCGVDDDRPFPEMSARLLFHHPPLAPAHSHHHRGCCIESISLPSLTILSPCICIYSTSCHPLRPDLPRCRPPGVMASLEEPRTTVNGSSLRCSPGLKPHLLSWHGRNCRRHHHRGSCIRKRPARRR